MASIPSEATKRHSTMKPEHRSGSDRIFSDRHTNRGMQQVRDKADERKEALVLLAIAFLFLANVLLYLCHHYGLMSQNDTRPPQPLAARVIID
jgi:hypothetical protein